MNRILCFCFLSLGIQFGYAQESSLRLTLEDAIVVAKNQSPAASLAKHNSNTSYWQYKEFKASLRPYVGLDATLPNFNRSISKITLPDGRDAFVQQSLANYASTISVVKPIGFTGGQLFVNSGIQRIDIFSDSTTTSYLSTPLVIGIRQPLLGFNSFKWEKRIAPMVYSEGQKKSLEDLEDISLSVANRFFDLLIAQSNYESAIANEANNDTLFKITKGRYNIGTIAENELLQMELAFLNSRNDVTIAALDMEVAEYKLISYLGLKGVKKIELLVKGNVPNFKADPSIALDEAKQNRSDAVAFNRKLMEAERDLMQAKRENRFNANLFATYGLTQNSQDFSQLYVNPQDQQQFSLGIQIPILDWGRARSKINTAQSRLDLVSTSIEQERADFDKDVYFKVMQFNLQQEQLRIASKADTVAQTRYEVTKQRYFIGKIDITQLNIASFEKDEARRKYFEALRKYWVLFYQLRKMTLYDFEANNKIK